MHNNTELTPCGRLYRIAQHEAGHAIAYFHYGFPIGRVQLDEAGGHVTPAGQIEKPRPQWLVILFSGPVTEFRYRGLKPIFPLDLDINDLVGWSHDFLDAFELDPSVMKDPNGCVVVCHRIVALVRMLNPEAEVYSDGNGLVKAMRTADEVATVYADTIRQFADVLFTKKKLGQQECAEWAALNFQKREVGS